LKNKKIANILENAIPTLYREMLGARDCSPKTLEAYTRHWKTFIELVESRKLGSDDKNYVQMYMLNLSDKKLSPASIDQALSAVRTLLKFVFLRGGPQINLGKNIKTKKIEKLPKILSEEEVENAIKYYSEESELELRNRVLLEILYSSGLRVSEAISIEIKDIYLLEGYIRVRGKGGKYRQIPIGREALSWIKKHMRKIEGKFLFPSRKKEGYITRKTAFVVVKKALKAIGIDQEGYGPHVFRHAFASHLLARGADLRVIQELLGHVDLETTQIYTHLLEKNVRSSWKQFHPHAQN